jgi:hypothetical protein
VRHRTKCVGEESVSFYFTQHVFVQKCHFFIISCLTEHDILSNVRLVHPNYFSSLAILETFYEVWKKSNKTDFLFTKVFIFSKISVIAFKIVPLGSYTPMRPLFPLLVAALEFFNRYGVQHVRYTVLNDF